jgi:hypothetical protein
MVKKTISAAESAEQVREKEELRARAARQAAAKRQAAAAGAAAEEEKVNVRVTKLGADKVSMGVHASGIGDAYFEHAEETALPVSVAKTLEERGFVEITGAAKIVARAPAKDDGEDKGVKDGASQ